MNQLYNEIKTLTDEMVKDAQEMTSIPREVFGLSGKEESLATLEAEAEYMQTPLETEEEKLVREAQEKADWDSSFGYDEARDNGQL